MYGDISWTTDILPAMQSFMGQDIVKGTLIAIASISIGVYGARGLISVFFKRD